MIHHGIPDKDKVLMRIKDIVLLAGAIGGLIIGVGKIYRKDFNLESAIQRLDKLEPIVAQQGTQLAVQNAQYQEIISQLGQLNRKIDEKMRMRG